MAEFFFRHSDAAQILIFAGCVSLLWAVEHVLIASPEGAKLRHTSINALFVLTALPVELALSVVCLGASHWAAAHHFGLVWLLPAPGNPWLRYGLVFVLLDLGDYVYHRFMHHTPWLWRFHLVHHTDQVVDSSTTRARASRRDDRARAVPGAVDAAARCLLRGAAATPGGGDGLGRPRAFRLAHACAARARARLRGRHAQPAPRASPLRAALHGP